MALTMQEVKTTDALRYQVFAMRDIGAASAAADQDCCLVQGLNGSGGTIVGIYARAGTAPVHTSTGLVYDVNKNGTTVFTSTKLAFATTAVSATGGTLTAAGGKVLDGDRLSLDCDSVGDGTAGSNIGVAVVVRCDEPND